MPLRFFTKNFIGLCVLAVLVLGAGAATVAAQQAQTWIRLTTASEPDRDSEHPSLSADGTKIVFHSDSDFLGTGLPDNQFEIWLFDTTTITYTRLTTATAANRDSFAPVISADGSVVVFRSNNDFLDEGISRGETNLWLYDRAEGSYTRLSASAPDRTSFAPALSADGSVVAFASDVDMLTEGIADNDFHVWLYDRETNERMRLTPLLDQPGDNFNPAVSRDGSLVAFSSDADLLNEGLPAPSREIWLYRRADDSLTRLTTASGPERDSLTPRFARAGTHLFFSSDSDFLGEGLPQNQYEIWRYSLAEETVTRLTTASSLDRASFQPVPSAGGNRVAFVSNSDFLQQNTRRSQTEIWLYDLRTESYARITIGSDPLRTSEDPWLDADGSRLVFSSDSDLTDQGIPAEQFEVWMFALD